MPAPQRAIPPTLIPEIKKKPEKLAINRPDPSEVKKKASRKPAGPPKAPDVLILQSAHSAPVAPKPARQTTRKQQLSAVLHGPDEIAAKCSYCGADIMYHDPLATFGSKYACKNTKGKCITKLLNEFYPNRRARKGGKQ